MAIYFYERFSMAIHTGWYRMYHTNLLRYPYVEVWYSIFPTHRCCLISSSISCINTGVYGINPIYTSKQSCLKFYLTKYRTIESFNINFIIYVLNNSYLEIWKIFSEVNRNYLKYCFCRNIQEMLSNNWGGMVKS